MRGRGGRVGRAGPVVAPIAWLLFAAATAAAPAEAKSITIATTPTIELRDGTLVARVHVANDGDDTAQSVTVKLRFRGAEARGSTHATLGPGASFDEALSLPAADVAEGRWPYVLAVDYTDLNQYPFQALQVGLVTSGNPPPAKVVVRDVTAPPLATTGTLTVNLKNLSNAAHAVTTSVVLPDGLEARTPTTSFSLTPWEERAVAVPVVNRAVLAGSRVAVFATVEYDDGAVHETALARGAVEVVAAQPWIAFRPSVLWVVAAVLVAAWLGFLAARGIRPARRQS